MTTKAANLRYPMKTIQTFTLVTISNPRRGMELFDLRAAAEASGMHPEMIREFQRARVVHAVNDNEDGDCYFDEHGIRRLRHIEYLRSDRHLSLHVICLLLRLLDRAERAEAELKRLRELV